MTGHRTHKGVFYFASRKDAQRHAETHGWPTDRIIEYGRGHAIQLRVSGPYVGPADVMAAEAAAQEAYLARRRA